MGLMLMDAADGGEGAGGGGGGGGDGKGGKAGEGKDGEGNAAGNITLSKEQFDALMAKIDGKAAPKKEGDGDLANIAANAEKKKQEDAAKQKSLETALKFNLGSSDWLKNNTSLLPKSIEGVLKAAEGENYADAMEKAGALKAGIIKEFFAVKENLDFLTDHQKAAVEEFNKLTNNVRQERAPQIFSDIFEPTLEMVRKIKKAEALKKGEATSTDAASAYEKRMIELSQKHYLGEKKNA